MITFDPTNKWILLPLGQPEVTMVEIWSAWVTWLAVGDNMKYPVAYDTVGGNPLSATRNLGLSFFQLNGWLLRPSNEDQDLKIVGNLYTDPPLQPRVSYPPGYNISVTFEVSNLVDSSLAQQTEIEQMAFGNEVTLDIDNITGHAVSGIAYPAGSQPSPVNNLPDAVTIFDVRGFEDISLKGNLTVGALESVAGFHIHGEGATLNVSDSTLTYTQGCDTHKAHIYDCLVTGYQGGENFYHNCIIENLENFHCFFDHCGFKDGTANTFTIRQSQSPSFTHVTYFKECYSDEGEFIVDRDGASPTMRFDGYSGDIKFINQNHVDVGDVYIHMRGGHITLDATVTEGYFHITGDYELKDFSGVNVSIHSSQDIAATATKVAILGTEAFP